MKESSHSLDSRAFDLFEQVARADGFTLNAPDARERFASRIAALAEEQKRNPIRLYGRRAEEMFLHVAAALGECRAIRLEDAGNLLVAGNEAVSVPDFRIVLKAGIEILVEVKNHHPASPISPLRLTSEYVAQLRAYASIFQRPVFLAVYWSRWVLWTLTPVARLAKASSGFELTLEQAVRNNEMVQLGDFMVGTRFPLRFRLLADRRNPAEIEDGRAMLTVGNVALYCGATRLRTKKEKNLAFNLMLWGGWTTGDAFDGRRKKNRLEWLEVNATPPEGNRWGEIGILGSVSSMLARRFNALTTNKAEVHRLRPRSIASSPFSTISDSYKSERLPLWRFVLQPSGRTG